MKKMVAAVAAGMMMFTVGACGSAKGVTYDMKFDCDRGDQNQKDLDCGYYNSAGKWVWYSWVKLGKTTKPPRGWMPPTEAREQFAKDHTK